MGNRFSIQKTCRQCEFKNDVTQCRKTTCPYEIKHTTDKPNFEVSNDRQKTPTRKKFKR